MFNRAGEFLPPVRERFFSVALFISQHLLQDKLGFSILTGQRFKVRPEMTGNPFLGSVNKP